MPVENETFRASLARLLEKGQALGLGGREELRIVDVAKLLGMKRQSVYTRLDATGFVNGITSYEKLARYLSREPATHKRCG